MRSSHTLSALAALSLCAGLAQAQWTGPSAPDSRLTYNTGPVYVGGALSTSRFNVTDDATSRIIGLHAFIGTPGNGARTTALWGETNNPKGRGLQGFNFATADSGDANNPATGIWAETASVTGQGIRARATATTGTSYAGYFDNLSTSGTGVFANMTASTGTTTGVYGTAASDVGVGVLGQSTSAFGNCFGVQGLAISPDGHAVYGANFASTGQSFGVRGHVASSTGFAGYFSGGKNYFQGNVGVGTDTPSTKVDATGSSTTGIILGTNSNSTNGSNDGTAAAGVKGVITAVTPGSGTAGVWGLCTSAAGTGYGVAGYQGGNGVGVAGFVPNSSSGGVAIYGNSNGGGGFAGFFNGNVSVIGTLAKSSGSFMIDHPLDPENKYLYHSFVESPDMMNIYNGVVHTDASGYAVVTLPEWFEALNRDFRYQLTILDESDSGFAIAKVVKKIEDRQFTIRTSMPNQEVSWQVTGIRHDKYADAHRIPIEKDKAAKDRGKYLNPDAFGMAPERGIYFKDTSFLERESAEAMKRQAAASKATPLPLPARTVNPAPVDAANTTPALVPGVSGGR